MRPGQNKRMRGRNNRKSPNPLTRSYESNGPDVKVRGTAHHVAEKYLQLARDAQSSGDPVMAESYLQHAEHYFRLIAAAQAAQQQAQMGFQRGPNDPAYEEEDDDDDFGGIPDRFASPPERFTPPPYGQPSQPHQGSPNGQPPQPYQGNPYNSGDRQQNPRGDNRNGQDRPYQDRNANRFNNNQNRGPRDNRPPRDFRNDQAQPQPRLEPPPAAEPAGGLPSFITAPVRVPTEAQPPTPTQGEANGHADEPQAGGYHLRPRRRRNRPEGEREGPAPDASGAPALSDDGSPYGE